MLSLGIPYISAEEPLEELAKLTLTSVLKTEPQAILLLIKSDRNPVTMGLSRLLVAGHGWELPAM